MKTFFQVVFAVPIGIILFLILAFAFLFTIATFSGGDKVATIQNNSILKLDLNYEIPEHTKSGAFDYSNFNSLNSKNIGLQDIIASIQQAKTDNKIKGIYIPMKAYANGMATTEAIRNALIDFKKSGKFIVTYGDVYTQKGYYVSSVADKIYVNPKGFIELMGFGTRQLYLKGMLDKLGVEVQAFHRGKFKSAFDPLVRTDMSESNRVQISELLNDVYGIFLDNVSASRNIDRSELHAIIDSGMIQNPQDAKKYHIITDTKYFDQVLSEMASKAGAKNASSLSFVSLKNYVTTLKKETNDSKIAVVFAEGSIVDGKGNDDEIGGDTYAKIFRELREDKDVKAVVLRINSGGGSALASEIMWREIILTKKEKPVVVSFGDVAASGGYYIACEGSRIFAEKNTITGSIGVFGLIPNASKLMSEKLGITTDEVRINKHGVMNVGVKPLDAFESAFIQRSIDSTYTTFLTRVAEGRKRSFAEIEEKAEGRVWSGVDAISIGLVDEIGGLDKAITYAKVLAKSDKAETVTYPQEKEFFEKVMDDMENEDKEVAYIEKHFGTHYAQLYKSLLELKLISGKYNIQARMPYEITFE